MKFYSTVLWDRERDSETETGFSNFLSLTEITAKEAIFIVDDQIKFLGLILDVITSTKCGIDESRLKYDLYFWDCQSMHKKFCLCEQNITVKNCLFLNF